MHKDIKTHIPHAIEVRNLSKTYDHVAAVKSVTFSVPTGSICGFIGPNGSGKTTTIRMLLGLIKPTQGEGKVLGEDIHEPHKYLEHVGAMIESPAFYPMLSGRENLVIFAKLGGIDESRIDPLLDLVGLATRGKDKFKTYSLGMKQRLGIAAALLPKPKLLILDEPTNGLDPVGIQEIRTLISKLAVDGTTIFVSSHILAELEIVCDSLVMYREGELLYCGSKKNLLSNKTTVLNVELEYKTDLNKALAAITKRGFEASIKDDTILVMTQKKKSPEISRLLSSVGITPLQIVALQPSLEETFFTMTGAK